MTINELKEKLATLEEQIFMLEMKDRWDSMDYIAQNKRHAEVRAIKAQLAEMEG